MGSQGHPRDDAEPAAAALDRPIEIGVRARIGDLDIAVRGHDLRFQEARRGHAIALGKTAEAAARDQPGDPDRQAAAALDIAARLGRDFAIDLPPDRARFDRHRRRRLDAPRAARADKGVVHGDGVHLACPDQKRIGRVRAAEIAVAAAFDDEPQIVLAREIDGGDDVGGRLDGDRIDARPRSPGVDPAERLGEPDLVAEIVGILQLLEDLARKPDRKARRCRRLSGDVTLRSRPPTSLAS